MPIVREIAVRDRHGDQHIVYEFQDRRFIRKVRKWKLDSGETLTFDGALFKLPSGETLLPVRDRAA